MSNQIGLKICLNQEIRKVSKAPEDLKSLIDKITLIFAANIPKKWSLQYIDSEGDHITISDELDFKEFIEESKASKERVFKKIFIVAVPEDQEMFNIIELPQEQEQAEINPEFIVVTKEDEILKEEDSFEILNNGTSEEQESPEPIPFVLEVEPDREQQQTSVSNTEAKNRNSRRYANKLVKKLAESNLSEANERLKGKLREVGKCLTTEQKIDLERKKGHRLDHCKQKQSKTKANLNQEAFPSLSNPALEDKIVHKGIRCDGCRQSPMIGIRYKCSKCVDFDYCERCEAKSNHPHPFIQMKKPEIICTGSSSHCLSSSNLYKGPQNQRSRQSDRRWKPLPVTLANFTSTFEDDEDEENEENGYSDVHVNENQHEKVEETLKRVYASEIQEKVQRLSEIFPERRLQSLYDFVSKAHHLSIEALVERWLLAQPS